MVSVYYEVIGCLANSKQKGLLFRELKKKRVYKLRTRRQWRREVGVLKEMKVECFRQMTKKGSVRYGGESIERKEYHKKANEERKEHFIVKEEM